MSRRIKRVNNGIAPLACTVIFSLVGLGAAMAREQVGRKLVVGIMIDQLRSDYIESLRDELGEGGFNRLLREGVYIPDLDFKVNGLDPVSATAIVYTGNYPRYNGITSSKVYSPEAKDMVFALNDPSMMGNFTTETFSPANLRLSTISDELAIAGDGENRVYSISPDAQQAVVMAGHAGNSAFWINENTGNWATTTYYLDNPKLLTERNYTHSISSRLDTLEWKPLRGTAQPAITSRKRNATPGGFLHRFSLADRNVYRMFSASPMGNAEVTDAALSYLENLGLNKGNGTAMLNIAYTAAPFYYGAATDGSAELEDTYLRLDAELSRLFSVLDKEVGMENVLVYVSSTGYFDDQTEDSASYRLPTGTFSVKRALSLLNSYLSAHFGNGSYVDTYSGGHIYLDHKEIEEKGLDLKEVAELSRDFLVRMSGVNDAFTMADIMSSSLPSMEGLRLGTDPKTGGDVILEFNAGWKITDDTRFPDDTRVERSTLALTPAFFMGGGIVPQTIEETVEATAIAPTVARILRIRSPNGTASKPLSLSRK